MEKPTDIENTGNRVRTKPGETRPNWPRNWRRKNSFKTSIAVILYGFEYATGWYYYLYGNIASFRFLLQLSAVMLFAFGVYGVTMDMEKRPIDRGVREATLFAMIARAYALPDGKGARALKSGVEALARDGVAMKEIDLSGADLRGAILVGADLRRANLQNAILIEADLSGADLFGANLSGAVFTRANLKKANLCESNLADSDLVGAVLHGADLERANLAGAELLVANFSNALMEGAIITSANGTYANFAGADLSDTNFSETELQGALFDGADIGGARLSQAYDLSDSQIDAACAPSDAPPILPDHIEWTDRRC